MKYAILGFLLICCFSSVHSQKADEEFKRHLLVGSSLTYIWDENFREFTYQLNATYALTKRWAVGAGWLHLLSGNTDLTRYNLVGLYNQFNVDWTPSMRVFAEGGLYYGDYCTCGDTNTLPYRNAGNAYWALGGGMTVRLMPRLHL